MERSMAGPSSSFKRSRRSSPISSKFASRFKPSSVTKQIKKVKFAVFDDAPDIPSGHAKRTIPNHGTGSAKTSEFMYFKKLSGTAGQKAISKPQSVEAQESNKVRVSVSNKGEKEPPVDFSHSISPHREQLNREPSCSGLYDTPIYKMHKECAYPALKITPLVQEKMFSSPEASRNSKCESGSVFSNKRINLIKLAAKNLSVGVDDFFLRRSELIGELIQRLGNKQQSETKKDISSSCLETPVEKYTHLEHRAELENLANHASNLPTLPSIEAGPKTNIRSNWSIQELESSEPYLDFSTRFRDKKPHDSANYLPPYSRISNLPTLPSIAAGLEPNIRPNWSIQELESSEPYPDFSTLFRGEPCDRANYLLPYSPCCDLIPHSFDSGVQDQSLIPYAFFQSPVESFQSFHDKNPPYSANYLLPHSPCHDLIPYSFGSGVHEKSLVPYTCFQSPVNNFQSPADKFDSELMSWDAKEKEEKYPYLPLALNNPASFNDEAEERIGDEFFGSPPRKAVSALESNSPYLCERKFFSNIVDADFSVAKEHSLLLIKENSANKFLEFGCDLPLLDPQYFLSGSVLCEYRKDSSDPFYFDS